MGINSNLVENFKRTLTESFNKYGDKLILNYGENIKKVAKELLPQLSGEEIEKLLRQLEENLENPKKVKKVFIADSVAEGFKKIAKTYKGEGVRITSKGEKVLLALNFLREFRKDFILKKADYRDLAALTGLTADILYLFWLYKEGFLQEEKLKNYIKDLLEKALSTTDNPLWVREKLQQYLKPVWEALEKRQSVVEELAKEELNKLAEELVKREIFGSEANYQKTAQILEKFITDYVKEKPKDPKKWVEKKLKKEYGIEEKITSKVSEVKETSKGFEYAGEILQSQWISQTDKLIKNLNEELIEKFASRGDSFGLHGEIAEHWHAKTFNINAKVQNKTYVAEVLERNTKNSVDIAVKNQESGEILRRYQSKYGKTATDTAKYLESGDYRGQKPLVPSDQLEKVNKIRTSQGKSPATDRIEYDGVESQPLSREEAEKLKEEIKRRNEILSWENVTYKAAFQRVFKDSAKVVIFTLALRGALRLGKALINKLLGKNVSYKEELKKILKEDGKEALKAGLKSAITGALIVAGRKGLIKILKNIPAAKIAAMVEAGFRIFGIAKRLMKGELTFGEFIKKSIKEVGGVAGGFVSSAKSFTVGASIGSVIPVIGTFVGGMLGAIFGGWLGETAVKKTYEVVTGEVQTEKVKKNQIVQT